MNLCIHLFSSGFEAGLACHWWWNCWLLSFFPLLCKSDIQEIFSYIYKTKIKSKIVKILYICSRSISLIFLGSENSFITIHHSKSCWYCRILAISAHLFHPSLFFHDHFHLTTTEAGDSALQSRGLLKDSSHWEVFHGHCLVMLLWNDLYFPSSWLCKAFKCNLAFSE